MYILLSFISHRLPVHSKRPKFSDIYGYLKTSTDQLLKWTDQDEANENARELGAPLSKGKSLYQDL